MKIPGTRLIRAYICLVGLPLFALLVILRAGDRPAHLKAPFPGPVANSVQAPALSDVFTLVLQIAMILLVARVAGWLFGFLRQPRVIGEMVAGIFLGPSVFGVLAPHISAAFFPPSSMGYLQALSQLGLMFFMFLVGLMLDPKEISGHGHAAVLTSHVSIVAPFVLGATSAIYLYSRFAGVGVTFSTFALFMGAAMSITAFPVLARILSEYNLLRSRIGTMAIACAAIDDVTGWCILASITVSIRTARSGTPPWVALVGTVAFVAVMTLGVKPLVRRLAVRFDGDRSRPENAILPIVLFVMLAALATESIGIHLLFGSFLAGAIMPKNAGFVRYVHDRLESLTLILLPLFFTFTGLRTSITLVHGVEMWIYCLCIIAVAVIGKMGGSMIAARAAGLPWRDSAGIGVLMNTRGLMELVILNIGLDLHVITPALFTMMVIMALVTTLMTVPLLRRLLPNTSLKAETRSLGQRVA